MTFWRVFAVVGLTAIVALGVALYRQQEQRVAADTTVIMGSRSVDSESRTAARRAAQTGTELDALRGAIDQAAADQRRAADEARYRAERARFDAQQAADEQRRAIQRAAMQAEDDARRLRLAPGNR